MIFVLTLTACGGGGGGGSDDSPGAAPDPDADAVREVEPNGLIGGGSLLEDEQYALGTGNSANDRVDYFRFVPTQSGQYLVTLSQFGSHDFDLAVTDMDGNLLFRSDSVEAALEQGSFEAVAGREYAIEVVAFETGGDTSSYKLSVNVLDTPPTQDPPAEEPPVQDPPAEEPPAEEPPVQDPPAEEPPAEEPPVQEPPAEEPPASSADQEPNGTQGTGSFVAGGQSVTGTANSVSDRFDFYRFVPAVSGTYTLTLSNYGSHDFDLAVMNSGGSVLFRSDAVSTASESGTAEFLAGLEYAIEVTAWETSGANSGYTLQLSEASGTGGVVPAPTVFLDVDSASVDAGNSVTLTWSSNNADTCTASGAWSGAQSLFGTLTVTPTDANSTFTLACAGAGGTTAREVTVTLVYPAIGTALISWTPPTLNSDGSALTDLSGYKIYYRLVSGGQLKSVRIDDTGLTSYMVDSLEVGTHEFYVTAFNATGRESNPSATASKTIPIP